MCFSMFVEAFASFTGLGRLEYLIKNGSENIADELRGEQLMFRRLANFQCREDGQDRGSGVREKAEMLVKLLNDKELLRSEREQAKLHHSKLTGAGPTAMGGGRRSPESSGSGVPSVLTAAFNEAMNEPLSQRMKTSTRE